MAKDVIARLKADTSQWDGNLKRARSGIEQMVQSSIGTLGKLAGAWLTVEGAVKAFDKIVAGSQTTTDAWGRTMQAGTRVVDSFFESLSQGSFQSFLSGLDNIIDKARAAYDAIDALGTYDIFSGPLKAKYEAEIRKLRFEIRAGVGDPNEKKAQLRAVEEQMLNLATRESSLSEDAARKTLASFTNSKMGTQMLEELFLSGDQAQNVALGMFERLKRESSTTKLVDTVIGTTSWGGQIWGKKEVTQWNDENTKNMAESLLKFGEMGDELLQQVANLYIRKYRAMAEVYAKKQENLETLNFKGAGGGSAGYSSTLDLTGISLPPPDKVIIDSFSNIKNIDAEDWVSKALGDVLEGQTGDGKKPQDRAEEYALQLRDMYARQTTREDAYVNPATGETQIVTTVDWEWANDELENVYDGFLTLSRLTDEKLRSFGNLKNIDAEDWVSKALSDVLEGQTGDGKKPQDRAEEYALQLRDMYARQTTREDAYVNPATGETQVVTTVDWEWANDELENVYDGFLTLSRLTDEKLRNITSSMTESGVMLRFDNKELPQPMDAVDWVSKALSDVLEGQTGDGKKTQDRAEEYALQLRDMYARQTTREDAYVNPATGETQIVTAVDWEWANDELENVYDGFLTLSRLTDEKLRNITSSMTESGVMLRIDNKELPQPMDQTSSMSELKARQAEAIKAIENATNSEALRVAEKTLADIQTLMAAQPIALRLDVSEEDLAKIHTDVTKLSEKMLKDFKPLDESMIGKGYSNHLKKTDKQIVDMGAHVSEAANAIGNMGGALQMINDPGLQAAGLVMGAIASVASSFAMALSKESVNVWTWIAAAIAGTATMVSTISSIKSATAGSYAEGGVVTGGPFTGDAIPIMANAGEVILNASQQQNIASQLQPRDLGGNRQPYVSGELLFLGLNNHLRRTGKGEIVTSRG